MLDAVSWRIVVDHLFSAFRSNVIWLMPDQLRELSAANIRWLVERANGKAGSADPPISERAPRSSDR